MRTRPHSSQSHDFVQEHERLAGADHRPLAAGKLDKGTQADEQHPALCGYKRPAECSTDHLRACAHRKSAPAGDELASDNHDAGSAAAFFKTRRIQNDTSAQRGDPACEMTTDRGTPETDVLKHGGAPPSERAQSCCHWTPFQYPRKRPDVACGILKHGGIL